MDTTKQEHEYDNKKNETDDPDGWSGTAPSPIGVPSSAATKEDEDQNDDENQFHRINSVNY